MTKRVRYTGPYDEVRVAVANQGDVYREQYVVVKQGGLLPLETDDGESVPASMRDYLIKDHPDFSEVKHEQKHEQKHEPESKPSEEKI